LATSIQWAAFAGVAYVATAADQSVGCVGVSMWGHVVGVQWVMGWWWEERDDLALHHGYHIW